MHIKLWTKSELICCLCQSGDVSQLLVPRGTSSIILYWKLPQRVTSFGTCLLELLELGAKTRHGSGLVRRRLGQLQGDLRLVLFDASLEQWLSRPEEAWGMETYTVARRNGSEDGDVDVESFWSMFSEVLWLRLRCWGFACVVCKGLDGCDQFVIWYAPLAVYCILQLQKKDMAEEDVWWCLLGRQLSSTCNTCDPNHQVHPLIPWVRPKYIL